MSTVTGLFTRADYDRLPEGYPAQLVEGWLMKEPAPTYEHQRLQSRLHAILADLIDPMARSIELHTRSGARAARGKADLASEAARGFRLSASDLWS